MNQKHLPIGDCQPQGAMARGDLIASAYDFKCDGSKVEYAGHFHRYYRLVADDFGSAIRPVREGFGKLPAPECDASNIGRIG